MAQWPSWFPSLTAEDTFREMDEDLLEEANRFVMEPLHSPTAEARVAEEAGEDVPDVGALTVQLPTMQTMHDEGSSSMAGLALDVPPSEEWLPPFQPPPEEAEEEEEGEGWNVRQVDAMEDEEDVSHLDEALVDESEDEEDDEDEDDDEEDDGSDDDFDPRQQSDLEPGDELMESEPEPESESESEPDELPPPKIEFPDDVYPELATDEIGPDVVYPSDWKDLTEYEQERIRNTYSQSKVLIEMGLDRENKFDLRFLQCQNDPRIEMYRMQPNRKRKKTARSRADAYHAKHRTSSRPSKKKAKVDTVAEREIRRLRREEEALEREQRKLRARQEKEERAEAKKRELRDRKQKKVKDKQEFKDTKTDRKEKDMEAYRALPWAEKAPRKGLSPVLLSDLPAKLVDALTPFIDQLRKDDHMLDDLGNEVYSYVSYQSGKVDKKKQDGKTVITDRGFAVQFQWEGKLTRIAMVQETRMGALVAAAARLDPRLVFHTTTVSASSWLNWMAKNQDAAAEQWLWDMRDNMDTEMVVRQKGGRKTTVTGAAARRRKAAMEGYVVLPKTSKATAIPMPSDVAGTSADHANMSLEDVMDAIEGTDDLANYMADDDELAQALAADEFVFQGTGEVYAHAQLLDEWKAAGADASFDSIMERCYRRGVPRVDLVQYFGISEDVLEQYQYDA